MYMNYFWSQFSSLCLIIVGINLQACLGDQHPTLIIPKESIAPVLVVIGVDVSGTFKNYKPLTPPQLKNICNHLSDSGSGGTVTIAPIGNPTDESFLRCHIEPIPEVDSTAILSERGRQRIEKDLKENTNEQNIQSFLNEYKNILLSKNHEHTDLNGFADKTSIILKEPQYGNHNKMVVIYSDGYADLRGEEGLSCSFENDKDTKVFLIGWKNKKTCKANKTHHFESPEGFISFFISN